MFNEKWPYTTIEDIPTEEIMQTLKPLGVNIQMGVNETDDWKAFSIFYGALHGLNLMEAKCFAEVVTGFMTDHVTVTENKYLKILAIQFDVLQQLPKIRESDEPEREQVKTLFYYIFILFHDKINRYYKKSERLEFRCTIKQLQAFNGVEGDSKTEKLETLLDHYYKI